MIERRLGGFLLLLAANVACDGFLVGGKCLEGYTQRGSSCVVEAQAGEGGAGGDEPGPGGADGTGAGGASGSGGSGSGQGGSGGGIDCGPLTACGPDCADLQTDEHNCGACGLVCPSLICEEGVCIGGPAGHVVVLGLDFRSAPPNSQISRVLGNAVFLHGGNPVRVVGLKPPTFGAAPAFIEELVAAEASARGRAFTYATVKAADVPAAVGASQVDVLVVLGSSLGRQSDVPAMAAALGGSLDSFFDDGGIIVTIPTPKSLGLVHDFLDDSGLLPGVTMAETSPGDLLVSDWTDALAVGLLSPLSMVGEPVTIVPADPEIAATVLTNDQGEPVALHRAVVGN